MSDFWEQYKRPEWQKKRLEVMEKAGFKCQDCDAADKTLNVHHAFYIRNRQPWEYPNTALRCLCEECHDMRHNWMEVARHLMGNLHPDLLVQAIGYVEGLLLMQGVLKHVQLGQEWRAARGLADMFGITSPDGPSMLIQAEDENGRLTLDAVDDVHEKEAEFLERVYGTRTAEGV